jgi:hypothetical protein
MLRVGVVFVGSSVGRLAVHYAHGPFFSWRLDLGRTPPGLMDGGDRRAVGPADSELQRTSDVATAHSPAARADPPLEIFVRIFPDGETENWSGATAAHHARIASPPQDPLSWDHGLARCLSWRS